MRILAVSGSLRKGSYNTALLRAAAEVSPTGVELVLFDGLAVVPPFNEDDEAGEHRAGLREWRRQLASADAVLFATPEYNGSIPGQLKNAVDWASRPRGEDSALWGKPVAVVGASTGHYGAAWAQEELRKALRRAGARVLDAGLSLPRAQEDVDPDGRLASQELRARLAEIVSVLADETAALLRAA